MSALLVGASLAGASCGGGDGAGRPDGGPEVTSRHPRLLKKDGEALSRDLAAALELPREDVCRELGAYDCARGPHRIVLGGVEPYGLRIDEPLAGVPLTAPIAVDRVALSACGRRARLDLADPGGAVVFGALARGEPGARPAAVRALYDRLLGRAPDADEAAAVLTLAEPPATDGDFATLSCFAVATSLEFLFH